MSVDPRLQATLDELRVLCDAIEAGDARALSLASQVLDTLKPIVDENPIYGPITEWPKQALDIEALGRGGWRGHAWIQWKGTNVCMDVHCVCGAHGHVDADFAYFYACRCGRRFAVGQSVPLIEVHPDFADEIAPLHKTSVKFGDYDDGYVQERPAPPPSTNGDARVLRGVKYTFSVIDDVAADPD